MVHKSFTFLLVAVSLKHQEFDRFKVVCWQLVSILEKMKTSKSRSARINVFHSHAGPEW